MYKSENKDRIKNLKFVLFTLILLLLPAIVLSKQSKPYIDTKVIEELDTKTEVAVIVFFKEDSLLYSTKNKKELNSKILNEKRFNVKQTQAELISSTSLPIDKIRHKFSLIPGFSAEITKDMFNKLKNNPKIEGIYKVESGRLFRSESMPLLKINKVQERGYTGKDQTICIVDTGVDDTHSELTGKIKAEKCYCKGEDGEGPIGCCPNGLDEDNNANDDSGRGTHIAGIVVGENGVAPDAEIIVVKVTNASGVPNNDDFVAGMDWCYNKSEDYNISIISISMGGDNLYTNEDLCDFNAFSIPVNKAFNSDIFVAVASGNDGQTVDGIPAPACASGATSVGATYDDSSVGIKFYWKNGQFICSDPDEDTIVDNIACLTNRQTLLDLLAPGCEIRSTNISSTYATECGTSMAAPHVSGAAALLLEKDSTLNPNQIKQALNDTGVPIYDSDTGLTFPRIDVMAAISYLTTHRLGDEFNGSVRNGQTWYTKLNVTGMQGFNMEVRLKEDNFNHDLDLTLIDPNGDEHPAPELDFIEILEISSSDITEGNWTIKVYADYVPAGVDSTFRILTYKNRSNDAGDYLGGINFTSTQISFISTCDPAKDAVLVFKAKEANVSAGDSIINITERTEEIMEAFKTGLVIPNHNMWVSLPLGGVNLDKTFSETWVSRQLLEDDVDLKFGAIDKGEPNIIKDVYDEWFSTGGSGMPNWWFRTAIIAGNVVVNATNCEISVVNVTMNVDTELMSASGNHPDIESWKDYFSDKLENERLPLEKSAVNNDPEFEYLREVVYPAITLAQWYKTLPREQIPYGDIIDSNNVSGLEADSAFDANYWSGQSSQFLYWIPGYSGYYVYGGISWYNANVNQTGGISNATRALIEEAKISSYVKEGNDYYYTANVVLPQSDLEPIALGFSSLTPQSEETINITVAIENTGSVNSDNSTAYIKNHQSIDMVVC